MCQDKVLVITLNSGDDEPATEAVDLSSVLRFENTDISLTLNMVDGSINEYTKEGNEFELLENNGVGYATTKLDMKSKTLLRDIITA